MPENFGSGRPSYEELAFQRFGHGRVRMMQNPEDGPAAVAHNRIEDSLLRMHLFLDNPAAAIDIVDGEVKTIPDSGADGSLLDAERFDSGMDSDQTDEWDWLRPAYKLKVMRLILGKLKIIVGTEDTREQRIYTAAFQEFEPGFFRHPDESRLTRAEQELVSDYMKLLHFPPYTFPKARD